MLGKIFNATAAALLVTGSAVYADSDDGVLGGRHEIRHVLLISVDGV